MSEINHPVLSNRKLIRSTIIAVLIGALVLVIAVLPAEYGIDPTGAGKWLGFSKLYTPENTEEAAATGAERGTYPRMRLEDAGSAPEVKRPAEADLPAPDKQPEVREDSVQVTVPAGKGIEYKVYMLKHGQMKYQWTTDKAVLYFDFHGEVNQANPPKETFYQSHTVAYSDNMVGTFLSPFEGKHGWYFRNSSDKDVVVTIRLKGEYIF